MGYLRNKKRFTGSGKVLLVAGLVVMMLVLVFVRVATGAGDSIDYINAERVQPLQRDGSLARQAQAHAEAMAEAGEIFHSALPTGDAEIVGRGASIGSIHDAFMVSPSHRATLLSDFARAGAGSTVSNGVVYVAVVFGGKAPIPTTTTAPKNTTTTERQENEQPKQEGQADRLPGQEEQEAPGRDREPPRTGPCGSDVRTQSTPDG